MGEREAEGNLGGAKGGETMVKMNYMREELIFNKKQKQNETISNIYHKETKPLSLIFLKLFK